MKPLFEQIAAMQDILLGSEPAPKRPTCRWCGEPGGDNCCHCEPVEDGEEGEE